MKKLSLLLFIFLPMFVIANEPVKAFGSIYFGMTKKEVNNTIRNHRSKHVLEIGGWEFKPVGHHSLYTTRNNGLSMLRLVVVPVPFSKYLTKTATETLLNDLKTTFIEAGYKLEDEHFYFPKPNLLVKQGPVLILSNEEKEQYIFITIPSKQSMTYTSDTFDVNIEIMWTAVADKNSLKKKESIKESAKEVGNLF